jgi:Zn-dependent M28 family amino/carboxypeptidase
MRALLAAPILAVALSACSLLPPPAAAPSPADTARVDPARLSEHVRVLASDEFQGRGPATEGETRTVDYLVRQFQALGLQPGGENGGWTQAAPLNRYTVPADAALTLRVGDWRRALVQGEDMVAVTMRPVDRVAIAEAPLVFVGYGVSAPERQWDDFKGVDLKGKIAVVLVNDPDFEADLGGAFGGRAMTYYGRWTYKFEEMARRGALGTLIVHETPGAGYGWTTVRNSNTGPQFDIVRADPAREKLLLQGWIQREVAAELFRRAGLDLEALKAEARTRAFRPRELPGARFSAAYALATERVLTHNVLARLPGGARAGETVMISAHWDHFGVGQPDATGDRIFHGAADDGTGVAAVLELARLFAQGPRPQRSVVFALWTAEERGLLGSEHYGAHPLYPLQTTAGLLNFDVLQTAGPARDIVLVGPGKDTLEDDLVAAAAAQGRTVTPDSHPEVGSFYRGDQFSLAKRGVPVLPLMGLGGGPDLVEGGRAAGDRWVEDFTKNRYHTPQDRWSPDWDLRGAAQDAEAVYAVARRLADTAHWPQWKPGAEFAAEREKTAAARR